MIERKRSWSKTSLLLLAFGLVFLVALPGWGDDDMCSLCDESSVKIGFGSSSISHERWYDLSSVFRLGNKIMIHTDNPKDTPDKPDVIIYASFDSQQSVKLEPQYGTCSCENQGHRASLSVSGYNLTVEKEVKDLAAKMKADGVSRKLWPEMVGPYVYRINVLAPDYGIYATSLLTLTDAANYAIGEARVDHYRMHDSERARICNYVGSVKQVDAEAKDADARRQQSSLSTVKYGQPSPLMALIK